MCRIFCRQRAFCIWPTLAHKSALARRTQTHAHIYLNSQTHTPTINRKVHLLLLLTECLRLVCCRKLSLAHHQHREANGLRNCEKKGLLIGEPRTPVWLCTSMGLRTPLGRPNFTTANTASSWRPPCRDSVCPDRSDIQLGETGENGAHTRRLRENCWLAGWPLTLSRTQNLFMHLGQRQRQPRDSSLVGHHQLGALHFEVRIAQMKFVCKLALHFTHTHTHTNRRLCTLAASE